MSGWAVGRSPGGINTRDAESDYFAWTRGGGQDLARSGTAESALLPQAGREAAPGRADRRHLFFRTAV